MSRRARCSGASSSVLADRLRELGEASLVAHDGSGYALTEHGRGLRERLVPLDEWAASWRVDTAD